MRKLFLLKILFLILAAGNLYSQSTMIPTGGKTLSDLQSVGSPVHIVQDRNNPDILHAVYTSAPYSDNTTFEHRTINYYYSSNRGLTWNFVRDFSQIYKAGSPSIALLSNGLPIIAFHGTQSKKTYTFTGTGISSSSFLNLGNTNCFGRTPQIAASRNINNIKKFYIVNSAGFSGGLSLTDSVYSNCVDISGLHPDSYSIAVSNDGKVGIAYLVDPAQLTGNSGDVYFMESENNGETFSAPVKIYDAVINPDGSFTGALRGISLIYNNNTPNIVFETTLQDIFGIYYKYASASIMYWNPNNQGSGNAKCKSIAQNNFSDRLSFVPFYKAYGNDVLTSLSRPSIGAFTDSNYLAVVFMASTQNTKASNFDTICYNALYVTYSKNKGESWTRPKRITPNERKDWTYPSVSSYNYSGVLPYTVNIVATKDSLPGSYYNNSFLGKSLAEQYYIKTLIGNAQETDSVSIISGKVRYSDNNQIVTYGTVKAMRYNDTTGQAVELGSSPVDENGNYSIILTRPFYPCYIVAYPNSEPVSDFVTTYYPNTIDWQEAQMVNSSTNSNNININVFRKIMLEGQLSISGTVLKSVTQSNSGLSGVCVYIKYNDSFAGMAETDSLGRYYFKGLINGEYDIITGKIGFSTLKKKIKLDKTIDTINFTMTEIIKLNSQGIPSSFNLYQNYPNPFNPATKIKFDISKSVNVTIKIYNVLGKEISVLLNEIKQPGSYIAEFNAENLPSGIYFYRITASTYTETKRMVIVK